MSSTSVIHRLNRNQRSYIVRLTVVTAMSGLMFGFDTAVINGALVYLRQQLQMSVWQTEVFASSLLVGAIVGAALSGCLSDAYGRRRMLSFSAVLFAVSSIATAISATQVQLSIARFAGGIAIGAGSALAPMYLAEVSPAPLRGRIVTMNQLAIVSGILLAYLINWSLAGIGATNWRWMFGIGVMPSSLLWIGLFFVPESPRWLLQHGHHAKAEAVLASLTSIDLARAEVLEVRRAIEEERANRGTSPGLSSARQMRLPLFIAVALAILSQVTGINTVLYYGSIILHERFPSQGVGAALATNVLIGLVNLIGTVIALRYIDRMGRRFLLLLASGGMAVSLLSMAWCFYGTAPQAILGIVSILAYIAFFAVGFAPALWAYISEIFPNMFRARALSIATVSLWCATFLVTLSFLSIVERLGVSGAFLIYAGFSIVSFLFVWKMVPETRGKTLEEIQYLWK
jgi:sugar porter (SP) family MFS transporter